MTPQGNVDLLKKAYAAFGAGNHLWQYDGKTLREVKVGTAANPNPSDLTAVGGTLYFTAADGQGNSQLWKYNGSRLTKIPVGTTANPSPSDLTAVGSSRLVTE